jgi:ATP-dependent exoDNAse (exonuclease V) beta subunit
MTVHPAKGLEVPVVVLADVTAKLAPLEASRSIDQDNRRCALRIGGWSPKDLLDQQAWEHARDLAEGVRLAYVAATRARDLLVVPAVGDEPFEGGWVSPLNRAVYPEPAHRRTALPAPGCPAFKRDSVLQRPDDGIASAKTVSPGLHRMGDGGHEVVWWDPAALHLDAAAPFGLRREELIARDVPSQVIADGTARHEAWYAARDAAIERGRTPWVQVATMTEWAAGDAWATAAPGPLDVREADVGVVTLPPDASGRPAGPRFGSLVHAVLATVPLDAVPPARAALIATHGRIVGATTEEIAAAGAVLAAVLSHPIVESARRAERDGRCYRELPLTLRHGDLLLEGTADLAFEEDGVVTVVDFKTDRAVSPMLERYLRQVGVYAEAIRLATGKPARAVLLQV